jgi:hypothetical protein
MNKLLEDILSMLKLETELTIQRITSSPLKDHEEYLKYMGKLSGLRLVDSKVGELINKYLKNQDEF